MGRAAVFAGAEVVGFDIARRPSNYGLKAVSRIWGGGDMKESHFRRCCHPAPDIIHASPLCNEFSALRRLGIHEAKCPPTAQMLNKALHHLEEYRRRRVQLD
eukprot:3238386-Pleurochrysis_carterae.AAC.1